MPIIEAASSFTISGYARLYEIHGNAIINHISDINELKKFLSVVNLPRSQASHKDYETWKKSGPCFPGTRHVLLQEMMNWVTGPTESRIYVLSGLAGIGKSTIAYTLATQTDELGLLGASFFFSRDDDNRNNAKRFFSTIAYQLCVYNEMFAEAIGDVLLTERGSAATTQDPLEQLKVFILDSLQNVVWSSTRPILVVVDALDECNEDDEHAIVTGLTQLVRLLPSFKVILTTRPQPLVDHLFGNHDSHKIFHLQDIEDKVVDSDIRLYLKHSLSLEQVQKRFLKQQWSASDEEIESLVHAAGRLFIIASTTIRYIFDKTVSNPGAQTQKLLRAVAQDHTPFKDLDHFYTVILRNVVPDSCDDDEIISRYQSVVGAVIFVQHPLSVSTLAHLIDLDVEDIRGVLYNLQSVILLGSDDVPRIYHQSFPDYLMDQARCKDACLQIDPKSHHTQMGSRCFEIMEKHLKYNIMGLGHPAIFMSNEDGLKESEITNEQLEEKTPQKLRYACVYWSNHLEVTDNEDLVRRLEMFANKHLLHWFEVLSLIGKLDSAHRAIGAVLKFLKSTHSDLRQLLSDALRFISKFYECIERSALHAYHSALPFTPTDSLLYRRYISETVDSIWSIENGPEKWDDALIANVSHGEQVDTIKFSLDSTLFVSSSGQFLSDGGMLKIHDATSGTPISTISGHKFAVANDFSIVASSKDNIIMSYNGNDSARGAMFTAPLEVQRLALSSESSRVAAALSDGNIWLWDSNNAKLINNFDGYGRVLGPFGSTQLQFSPIGSRLAYATKDGFRLLNGINGEFIADLQCGSRSSHFAFSGDGFRIATLSTGLDYIGRLTLRNSESGVLVDSRAIGHYFEPVLAISENGSLLAITSGHRARLWSYNDSSLSQIRVLELKPQLMAFSSDDVLAMATSSESGIKLYNVKTHSFIYTLPFNRFPTALAFSPDCNRLAAGSTDDCVHLWNIQGIDAPSPSSNNEATAVTALALSRDASHLACGFEDGTVKLWGTTPRKRRIGQILSRLYGTFHKYHKETVTALAFDPDGRLLASGSTDWTIKLWNCRNGSLRATLKSPIQVWGVALTSKMLVSVGNSRVMLWNLSRLYLVHTLECFSPTMTLSISDDRALVAVGVRTRHVVLIDAVFGVAITTIELPPAYDTISTMSFLPDNSQLVAQDDDGNILSFNLSNEHTMEGPTLEHLIQLPGIPLWRGAPIWRCQDKGQHYLSALFSQDKTPVPVLWIPRDLRVKKWTQGSSMIALSCEDGRVVLLRLHPSRVN